VDENDARPPEDGHWSLILGLLAPAEVTQCGSNAPGKDEVQR